MKNPDALSCLLVGTSIQNKIKNKKIGNDRSAVNVDFFKTGIKDSFMTFKQQQHGTTKNDNFLDKYSINENNENSDFDLDAKALRNKYKIRLYDGDETLPNPISSFDDFIEKYDLDNNFKTVLKSQNFDKPTPIQMQAMPMIMEKVELISLAPTGSGKTLAFLLPILSHLKGPRKEGFRALIITPTKELAEQIQREMNKLYGKFKINSVVLTKSNLIAEKYANQDDLACDILISTPQKLVNGVENNLISLKNVQYLVLDEADRLLDDGFLEQVDSLIGACSHQERYTCLFSATISSGVESIAKSFMKNPVRIVIGSKNSATETIEQKLVFVGREEGKLLALRQMISTGFNPPMIIFVQSIERAKELFHELVYENVNVEVIHSERSDLERKNIIQSFRSGKIWVLIATELMARGIDFKGVQCVINYDFPQTSASYIHRIGRTGRAGRPGKAITYFTKEDAPFLKIVVNVMRESGCEVPEWMLALKKPSKSLKSNKRKTISTLPSYDKQKLNKKRAAIAHSKALKQSKSE
ncbi:P-loop containing nucleoside triphosphate hydrolase protein [Rozella allomycis CSF55]|uniref:RNA helicase n=1 Tax=Rozella allomycis (strain CSF55) TaxID=988480 RepID=A0A4P9YIZ4_ROZAC|nr:P-loop containing nucleoside triphosphate hydrolase protein [Rozella allomycis CSF55]